MKTTERGQIAEKAVADLLEEQGFEIIDRNWKTKDCEIDIVAQQGQGMYFVDVKYRSRPSQGNGLGYIPNQKLNQMSFAAEIWKQNFNYAGDYRLMATTVSGIDCENIEIIELD